MALPIIPIIIFAVVILLVAWKRDVVLKVFVELIVDIAISFVALIILNLIVKLSADVDLILLVVFTILFFILHYFYAQKGIPNLPRT